MSVAPIPRNMQALGWHLLIAENRDGSGEAKLTWDAEGARNPDFTRGRDRPALALEEIALRLEQNSQLSMLDLPILMGLTVRLLMGKTQP